MRITEALKGQQRAALDDVARRNGLDPSGLDALLAIVEPAIAQRLEATTLSRGGLADLVSELMVPEHRRLIEQPEAASEPWVRAAGIGALDTIFWDKANSRALAARASAQTGIGQDVIQKLLPILASLILGALAKGSQGGLQDILRRLPDMVGGGEGDARSEPPRRTSGRASGHTPGPTSGGLGDVLSRIPGLPEIPGFPRSGSGSLPRPVPDPSSRSTRGSPEATSDEWSYGNGSPLPLPGSDMPGVDEPADDRPRRSRDRRMRDEPPEFPQDLPSDLPDVIRRRSTTVDGNPVSDMVRDVLGSLLGFQSKSVVGWIVRFLVVRWGWNILRGLIGRIVPR